MAKLSDQDRLQHMLDFGRTARKLTRGRKRVDLDSDKLFELAMARALEVIGEAASQVSTEFQERFSEIPWKTIISLRNRLIHGYDTINPDITWQILTHDLPTLINSLERILKSRAVSTVRRKGKKKNEPNAG